MARPESTTDPPEHRCPRCNTVLLIVETNLKTFRCCEQCGWYAPPGFEKVRVVIRWDETDQLPVRRAYSYEEQPQRAVQRPLRRIFCSISEMSERVASFQRKFLNNRPSSQPQQNPEAPALRRLGGNKPQREREAARQLVRAVLQRHRDRVLAREILIKEVADELKKQKCWSKDGWHGHAAMNLISQEMIAFRNSR